MTAKTIAAAFILMGTTILAPAAAEACSLVTLKRPPSVISYDPFSGLPQNVSFTVQISSLCSSDELAPVRRVKAWFSDETAGIGDRTLGGARMDIFRNGQSFLLISTDVQPPFNADILTYDAHSTGAGQQEFTYSIVLPANQVARSESKTIRMKYLYQLANASEVLGSLDIPLTLDVQQTFDLRLAAGGGTAGEIDFGTFTGSDATRSLNLRVGATLPFKITMSSTQGNQLRRTNSCGLAAPRTADQAESIGYAASLDGQALTPNQPFTREQTSLTDVSQRVDLPFSITVPGFNPIERRAGQYCDVITLRIEPRG
jgi:hypothetical protein